jgi:hypothetical protein
VIAPLDATVDNIQPELDYYLYGGLTAAQQVLPDMIERDCGTLLFTTGGSSMDPLVVPPEFSNIAVASERHRLAVSPPRPPSRTGHRCRADALVRHHAHQPAQRPPRRIDRHDPAGGAAGVTGFTNALTSDFRRRHRRPGSIEGRIRLGVEAAAAAIGPDRVGFRISRT